MTEPTTPDHFHASLNERERASEYFRAVLSVHNAAIQAFEIVPTLPTSEDGTAMWFRLRGLGKGTLSNGADEAGAQQMLNVTAAERQRGYQVIRSSALIAVCAAFEYLLRATFVSQAAFDPPAAAALLHPTRIKMSAAEVLGAPETEQWFAIADQLLLQMPNAPTSMSERVKAFLTRYMYVSDRTRDFARIEEVLTGEAARKVDEAYLTRNCLVHNGGRISSHLSMLTGQTVGHPITLADGSLRPMLNPIRSLADALDSLMF